MANDSPLPLLALAGAGYLLWKYFQPTAGASPAPSITAASPISSTPTIYGASNPSYGSYQQPSSQTPPQSSAASLFQSFFPSATTAAPPQPPLTYWNPQPFQQPAAIPPPPPPVQAPSEPLTMLQLAQRQYANPTPEQVAAVTADATGQVYNPPAQAVNCPAWLQWFQTWTYITGQPKPGAPPPPSC